MSLRKIAYIGPLNCYTKTKKIKESLYKIKQLDPHNTVIVSGGNDTGIEFDVKVNALAFGLMYKEFTPAFKDKNEWSIEKDEYYNKKYHYSFIIDRYNKLVRYCDMIVFGHDENSAIDPIYVKMLETAQKKGKKIVFI